MLFGRHALGPQTWLLSYVFMALVFYNLYCAFLHLVCCFMFNRSCSLNYYLKNAMSSVSDQYVLAQFETTKYLVS